MHTGICSCNKHDASNDKDQRIDDAESNVLPAPMPFALFDELEPEQSGKVKGEAGDEERGDETEQGVEEGNGLGNDPANNGNDGDESNPDPPRLLVSHVLDVELVLERQVHNVSAHDSAVDTSGNEDDGERDAECDAGDGEAGREQSGRLDRRADECVDESASQGVDEDFNQSQSPDGFDEILGSVHLRHETELADGKGVCENNVGGGQEGSIKGGTLFWPELPVHGGEASGSLVCFDTSGNDGDEDGSNDGDKVNVAENGDIMEGGRQGHDEQDNGGNNGPDQCANGGFVDNADECNGTRQGVRADQQHQEEHKHDSGQPVAEASPDQSDSFGIIVDVRVLQLDLSDDIGGVDGDETETNTHDDTRNHTQSGES